MIRVTSGEEGQQVIYNTKCCAMHININIFFYQFYYFFIAEFEKKNLIQIVLLNPREIMTDSTILVHLIFMTIIKNSTHTYSC